MPLTPSDHYSWIAKQGLMNDEPKQHGKKFIDAVGNNTFARGGFFEPMSLTVKPYNPRISNLEPVTITVEVEKARDAFEAYRLNAMEQFHEKMWTEHHRFDQELVADVAIDEDDFNFNTLQIEASATVGMLAYSAEDNNPLGDDKCCMPIDEDDEYDEDDEDSPLHISVKASIMARPGRMPMCYTDPNTGADYVYFHDEEDPFGADYKLPPKDERGTNERPVETACQYYDFDGTKYQPLEDVKHGQPVMATNGGSMTPPGVARLPNHVVIPPYPVKLDNGVINVKDNAVGSGVVHEVFIAIHDGDHFIRIDGDEVEPVYFLATMGERFEDFYLRHADENNSVESVKGYAATPNVPRKVEHVSDIMHLMPLSIYYDDTGEEVLNVFAYDLDNGYCWQHMHDEKGIPIMDGPDIKSRRVNGKFTVRKPEA